MTKLRCSETRANGSAEQSGLLARMLEDGAVTPAGNRMFSILEIFPMGTFLSRPIGILSEGAATPKVLRNVVGARRVSPGENRQIFLGSGAS